MAFIEKQAYKIEVNENFSIGVRRADIILKDDVEVGRSYHRSVFQPGDDVSGEVQEVQDVATAVWTPEVIAEYEASLPVEEPVVEEPVVKEPVVKEPVVKEQQD